MSGQQILPQTTKIPPSIVPLLAPYLPVRDIPLPLPRPTPPTRPRQPRLPNLPSSSSKVDVRSGSLLLKQSLTRPPTTYSHVRATIRSALSCSKDKDPYAAAFRFLDGQFVWNSKDLAHQQEERIRLYTLLVQQFLHRPTLDKLIIAIKLLKRQHAEGLLIDPRILTVYLKASLAQPAHGRHPMRTIAAILPLLPQRYDKHLLTLILHTLVKYEAPEPEDVKRMINGCLGIQTEQEGIRMEQWDLELWDVYLGAILAKGKYREGINLLVQFQSAVRAAQKRSIEKGTAAPSKDAIARPYISLLTYWIKSGFPDPDDPSRRNRTATRTRIGSDAPLSIARHGLEALAGEQVPLELLNAWMSAEVVAGNVERAGELWMVISGDCLNGKRSSEGEPSVQDIGRETILEALTGLPHAAEPSRFRISPNLKPDANTYTTMSRLMKRLSMSPPRPFLRRYLSQPECITTESLNATLSTLFAVSIRSIQNQKVKVEDVDLPAVFMLLERFDSRVIPNGRTIDVIAAGMLRLAKYGLSILETGPDRIAQHLDGESIGRSGEADKDRLGTSRISLEDWSAISRAIHCLREDMDVGDRITALPLGTPLGQLVDLRSPQAIPAIGPDSRDAGISRYATESGGLSVAEQLLTAMKRYIKIAIEAQLVKKGQSRDANVVLEQAQRDMGLGIRHG